MPARVGLPTSDDRIRAASWFAEHGFGVFPVWSTDEQGTCRCPRGRACDSPGKHPIVAHGFKEATTDLGRIRTLLSAGSAPNYGLVPPEGVFVLDVDGPELDRLAALEQQHGPLPVTLRTKTANGEHIFLHWPGDIPRPIGQLFGFVTRWGSGSGQGYVVGPRSVHRTGVEYAPAGGVFEIAELPDRWATAVMESQKAEPFIEIDSGGYRLPDFGFTGKRYDEILHYVASRYMRGISREEIWAGVLGVLAPRFEYALSELELKGRFERAWRGTAERLGQPVDLTVEDVSAGAAISPLVGWPEPMAEAAYHGPLGEVVDAVSPVTEADRVGILGTLVATVGACMGHHRSIYQGAVQTPNLFVVLVGDSSHGRKGTATSVAREVMTAAYPEWEDLIVAGLGSGEGLVMHLKKQETTEHRALVMESEFGRLLTVMNREGSTLSPVVRDGWDGVPMGRFLARDQALVKWHHVALIAHVTPVELRAKLRNVDAANGFGNRFLWLAVKRSRLIPFPESPRRLVEAPTIEALHRAIVEAQTPAEVHWSEAAADRWEWLYATIALRRRHGLLGALLARAEAQIARLALLYALLDRSKEILPQHLAAAEAIWTYNEHSLSYVFGPSTGNRDADVLRDMLADGPLEWQAAKKAVGVRSAADLQEAIDVLLSLGLLEVLSVPRDSGGRPRRVLRLTPKRAEQTVQTVLGTAQENGPDKP